MSDNAMVWWWHSKLVLAAVAAAIPMVAVAGEASVWTKFFKDHVQYIRLITSYMCTQ